MLSIRGVAVLLSSGGTLQLHEGSALFGITADAELYCR